MGLKRDIRAALEAHLAGVAGLPPAASWSLENTGFEPAVDQPWLRCQLAPGFRDRISAPAQGAYIDTTGLLFVDLFFPLEGGTDTADDLGGAIELRFPPGQQFALTGGLTLRVTRSIARAGRRDGEWYMVPVEIGWEVQTINALV